MAQLIPSRNGALPRMTQGERRVALRLEDLLEDDYLTWYDVPIGPKQRRPDFVVLHPRRGFLILEVKDWRIDTIHALDKASVTLATDRGLVVTTNPLAQARSYALELAVALERDPALRQLPGHPRAGKLILPYGYGVILSHISRAEFDANQIGDVWPAHLVLCRDEIAETVSAEAFQERLWAMFASAFPCALSLPQVDRFRWHVFPELRIADKPGQFGMDLSGEASVSAPIEIPDLIKVLDSQQEYLARSLGEGHRVIHGVAGSGKTMILGFRCLQLARELSKPILVLCYNRTLASRLEQLVDARGAADRVAVRSFHAWCLEMLRTYHVPRPPGEGEPFIAALVPAVIAAVERGQIPRFQYGAILVDEGHDFEPDWFRLIVQMVDPETNALLVLYDDTQSIYTPKKRRFSFASVGIEARGRTTILRLNYRNTLELMSTARAFLAEGGDDVGSDNEDTPAVAPTSAGRRGPFPELVRAANRQAEMGMVAQRIADLLAEGVAPDQIGVLYRTARVGHAVSDALSAAGVPWRMAQGAEAKRELFSGTPSVKLLTMHSSKGLEFSRVFIPDLGGMPYAGEDESDEARLLYVAMTRALDAVVLSCHSESAFTARIRRALNDVEAQLAR